MHQFLTWSYILSWPMHEPSSATFFLCQFVLRTNSVWSEVWLEGKVFVEMLRIRWEFGSPKYESCLCPLFHMHDYRCTTFILWCTATEIIISFDAVGVTESSSWAYHSSIMATWYFMLSPVYCQEIVFLMIQTFPQQMTWLCSNTLEIYFVILVLDVSIIPTWYCISSQILL